MKRRRLVWILSALPILMVGTPAAHAQVLSEHTESLSYDSRLRATTPSKAASPRKSEPALELRLTSRFAISPAYLRSLIRVSPHPDNRLLRVSIDSADFYRSSDVQLDGIDAPRSHFFAWEALPAGTYDMVVTVFGPEGPRSQRRAPFEVLGVTPHRD